MNTTNVFVDRMSVSSLDIILTPEEFLEFQRTEPKLASKAEFVPFPLEKESDDLGVFVIRPFDLDRYVRGYIRR